MLRIGRPVSAKHLAFRFHPLKSFQCRLVVPLLRGSIRASQLSMFLADNHFHGGVEEGGVMARLWPTSVLL